VCRRLYIGSWGVSEGGRLRKGSSTDTEQWPDFKYKRGAWERLELGGS
jgi:hypothetical protein